MSLDGHETTHEHCDQCGFDGARYDDQTLLSEIRALGPRWQSLLASAGSELRVRPEPEVWSAIEYAAHSRDITALHVYGVRQALTEDEPMLPPISGDIVEVAATAYGDEDADEVAAALTTQAVVLAQAAEDAGTQTWARGITVGDIRSDVRQLLQHALHDSVHHVRDVERGLTSLRQRGT